MSIETGKEYVMYRGGYSERLRRPAPERSVEDFRRKKLTTAQDVFDDEVRKGVGTRATIAQNDVAHNVGEMVLFWKPILQEARRRHSRRPRIPEDAKAALRAAGINPPVRV